jgi:hypothetical protein
MAGYIGESYLFFCLSSTLMIGLDLDNVVVQEQATVYMFDDRTLS